jgi:uncharacterized membrane protein YccC
VSTTYEHPAAHPPPPREPLHHVRAAATFAQARPAYAGGLRAGIATVVPLLVDHALGLGGGTWMSLGGLHGALVDRGGSYRARAILLSAVAVVSAIAVFLGSVMGAHPVLAIGTTFLFATACGLMRVWPDVGPSFGVTTLVTYSIALAAPTPTLGAAAMRALFIAIGALWAMLITIVVWPLRPYRPVRLALATCYREIAGFLDHATETRESHGAADVWAFRADRVAIRTALEAASKVLATTRRSGLEQTRRGERLLMLHELADQTYVHVLVVADMLEEARASVPPVVREAVAASTWRAASALRDIATRIESERDLPRVAVDWNGDALRATSLSPEISSAAADANRLQLATLLDQIADYATVAAGLAATLNSGRPVPDLDDRLELAAEPRGDFARLSFAALLRPDSVVLHHALRVGVVTTFAAAATTLLHLNHGYWATITAVVILQPYTSTTLQKALQRVLGTILGAGFAALISFAFGGTPIIFAAVFIFTVLCVTLLPLNYGAYTVFGTPAFVLLAESSAGNWHLTGVRVINTFIGGGLALLGARFLWPVDEWNRLPEYVASAIRDNAELIRRAAAVARTGGMRAVASLGNVRRSIALDATNAEDAFQRLLGDYRGPSEQLEPIMACLVYTRRLAAGIAGLALIGVPDGGADVERFVNTVAPALDDVADAIAAGRAPAPLPDVIPPSGAGGVALSPMEARMRRIRRQLTLLHDAADRWMSSSGHTRRRP